MTARRDAKPFPGVLINPLLFEPFPRIRIVSGNKVAFFGINTLWMAERTDLAGLKEIERLDFLHVDRLQQILILGALIFLIMSIATVVATIAPRLAGHVKGLVYFGAIAARTNATEYISDVLRANQPELDSAIAHHIFEMAGICDRKQKFIRWAMWLGLIGFVAGMVWLAVVRITATPSISPTPDHWDH